jgi:hypothetical protein
MSPAPEALDRSQHALAALLQLARRARRADGADELSFILANETFQLAPYRQAAFIVGGGVRALSGVSAPEQNAPFVQWLTRVTRSLEKRGTGAALAFDSTCVSPELAESWSEWLPAYALYLPLPGTSARPAALLLAREEIWGDDEIALLVEWAEISAQAWRQSDPSGARSRIRTILGIPGQAQPGWRQTLLNFWRIRWLRYTSLAALILLLPVRLTVLAPGELTAAHPAIVRAPFDGVVERVLVQPNQRVNANDPLLTLDKSTLQARSEVAQQALVTAEAEYRQQAQIAVFDVKSKARLADLQGAIEEKRAEAEYVRQQLARSTLTATRDGIVMIDDPTEWVGRPVSTGERIASVADERDVEIEAWLAPGDLIDWVGEPRVTLYLNTSPLSPVSGKLRYVTYEALQRPDGSYAYRLRATLDSGQRALRVGLKGTAKIAGKRVPLVYWMLRRPLAAARQFAGV